MTPFDVATYFKDNGYRVILTNNNDQIDALSTTADACILYYLYDCKYKPLGLEIEAFGHHFVEYHRNADGAYRSINATKSKRIRPFHYPSEYATNYVAILIYK